MRRRSRGFTPFMNSGPLFLIADLREHAEHRLVGAPVEVASNYEAIVALYSLFTWVYDALPHDAIS